MHYGMDASCFKYPGVTASGSTVGLNVLDAEKLNDAYNCPGCLSYRFRFPNQIDANSNPLEAGTDGRPLYSCRVYMNGDIVPGKAVLGSSPACWVSYNGREVGFSSGFEVLTNPSRVNFRWIRSSSLPSNAIAGGRTISDEVLYVARCYHTANGKNLVTPGKVFASKPNVAYAPYGFAEIECTNFEILVC